MQMLLMISQLSKQLRAWSRYISKMNILTHITCPSSICRTINAGWKLVAFCLLPLLLCFYEAQNNSHKSAPVAVALFFAVIVSLFGVLYFCQDNLLFYADTPENSRLFVQTPPDWVPYEIVDILTEDVVKLHAFLLKSSDWQNSPTVVYFHGNAGNIGHRLPNAMEMVAKLGVNVLLVDYRGYGKSTGTPCERGLYMDGVAAVEFALSYPGLDHSRICVFGRSLGGAVAVELAATPSLADRLYMLIVENTFTHIADVAEIMFHIPGFNYIPKLFYKNKFASMSKVGGVKTPSLFISGQADQLVPPHMMSSLFQRCSAPKKRLLKVRGGTHNETWMTQGYYEMLAKFFAEVSSGVADGLAANNGFYERDPTATTTNSATFKPSDLPIV
jgi:fermentation-respiration switch protein FrsA (DUF1100 family)